MTIAATNSLTHHTATGGEDTYTFSWPFNDQGDIRVATCKDEVYTDLALTTGFTVTAPALDGGTVTIVAGNPTAGTLVAIYRDEDFIQDTPFKNNSAFSRELSEDRLDQNVMYDQDKQNQIDRVFPRIHPSDARDVETTLPGDIKDFGDGAVVLDVDRKGFGYFPDIAIVGRAGQGKVDAEAARDAAEASATAAANAASSAESYAADAAASAANVVPVRAQHGMEMTSVHTSAFTAEVAKINAYDPTGGTFTITMPTTDLEAGDKLAIKNVTGAMIAVTVDGDGNTLDDLDDIQMLYPFQCLYWFYDGSNWFEYSTYDEGYDTPLPELAANADGVDTVRVRQKFGYPDVIALTMQNDRRYYASGIETINLGNSGINGLDTGSQAASTWYYIYAVPINQYELGYIASATNPDTGPTGYTANYRYLGCVYTTSGNDVTRCVYCGNTTYKCYNHNLHWPININAFDDANYNVDEWHPQSDLTSWQRCKPYTWGAVEINVWWDSDGNDFKQCYVTTHDSDVDGDPYTVVSWGGRVIQADDNDSSFGRYWVARGEHDELFWAFDNYSGGQNCDLRVTAGWGWLDRYLP